MSVRLFPARRVAWMPLDFPWQPPTPFARHCCAEMGLALEHHCGDHHDPFQCPDVALVYHEPFEEYGVPIRDGTYSYLVISHCPFCGSQLPDSGRDGWFDAIEHLGLDETPFDKLPAQFRSALWRRTNA